MSKTVASAAHAVRAKALAPAKVLHKRDDTDKPAHDDARPTDDDSSQHAAATHSDSAVASMSGDYSFKAALADAEASQALAGGASASNMGSSSLLQDTSSSGGSDHHNSDVLPIALAGGAIAIGTVILVSGGGHHNNTPTAPVNTAPTFAAATTTLAATEDTAATFTPAATDAEKDAITYSVSTAPTHGTTAISATGVVTYTPAANYNGTDSFIVTAKDPAGLSSTQTVNVTVAAVNDAPTVAATQAVTTTEDTAKAFTVAGADVENDPLTYSVSTAAKNGTVTVGAGGNLTYTPNANFNGTDTAVVTVSDGKGGTATETVTFTVTAVNDAPVVAATQAITTAEDTSKAVTVTATDVEGEALTYSILTGPAHGGVSGSNGTYTYAPAADFNGTDSFVIKVTDASGASSNETVNVTVTPVNDAPVVAATQAVAADTGAAKAITVAATDVDGDPLAYSLTTAPTHGTVVAGATPGTYTYTSAAGYTGADSFVVKVDDGHGGTASETVNLTVAIATAAVTVNAAGNGLTDTDSANVNTTYTVQLNGSYTHTIAGFGAGDHIVSPAGVPVSLINSNFADGSVTLQYAQNGQVANVVLTGLTAQQDAQLFGPNGLNTVFGAGTFA